MIKQALVSILFVSCGESDTADPHTGVFQFEQSLVLPGQPEEIYDAISSDISD